MVSKENGLGLGFEGFLWVLEFSAVGDYGVQPYDTKGCEKQGLVDGDKGICGEDDDDVRKSFLDCGMYGIRENQ